MLGAAIEYDLLIDHARELCLAPPDGGLGVLPDGAIACRDGKIVWVGPSEQAARSLRPADGGCALIDATGCTVLPGLIDPHAHLPSHGWRSAEFAQRLAGVPYLDILAAGGGILHTVRETATAPDELLLTSGRLDLDHMLLHGVTTVEAKSGYGLDTAAELRLLRLAASMGRGHPVAVVPTFLGAHAIPPAFRGNPDGYVELVMEEMLPAVGRGLLSEFCDVFCETGVFTLAQTRRILERAREHGLRLKLHADELSWSGGAELAGELGAVSADHLLFASPAGAAAMAASGTVGVLLPVTVLSLLAEGVSVEMCRAQARRMREAGVRLAIGTDYNPGTAPCRSLQLAMSLGCRIFGLTPAEAIIGVTRHAACALGRGDRIGSLVPGYRADITVFGVRSHAEIAYRLGDNQVRDVVSGGEVVVRNGKLAAVERG
jgi:imidazolonepropionase